MRGNYGGQVAYIVFIQGEVDLCSVIVHGAPQQTVRERRPREKPVDKNLRITVVDEHGGHAKPGSGQGGAILPWW